MGETGRVAIEGCSSRSDLKEILFWKERMASLTYSQLFRRKNSGTSRIGSFVCCYLIIGILPKETLPKWFQNRQNTAEQLLQGSFKFRNSLRTKMLLKDNNFGVRLGFGPCCSLYVLKRATGAVAFQHECVRSSNHLFGFSGSCCCCVAPVLCLDRAAAP